MNSITEQFTIWATCACCLIAHAWDCPIFYNFAIGFTLGASFINLLKIKAIARKLMKEEENSSTNPWNPFPTIWVDVERDFTRVEVIIQSDPYKTYSAKVYTKYRMGDEHVICFNLTDKSFIYEKGEKVDRQFDQIIAWRRPS